MKKIQAMVVMIIALEVMTSCHKENPISSDTITNSQGIAAETNPQGIAADFQIPKDNGSYRPLINPADFVTGINNLYFPQDRGDKYYYRNVTVDSGVTTTEDIYITVTRDTKIIMSVTCEVVHDQVKVSGVIMEDTYDYYAQDKYSNVWYFGEDTRKLEPDGSWSTEGSFTAGIDGALPGIVMLGDPQANIGVTYRQEYYKGQAEDKAKVLNTNSTVTVAYGTFINCVETEETSALDRGVIEHKWYAPGLGQVKASVTIGGNEQEELIATNHH